MSEMMIVLIPSVLTFMGVVVTCFASSKATKNEITHKLEIAQAVQNEKIDELTREVRLHNSFAQRVPVVENDIKTIKDEIQYLKKEA
jgi:hypothetical protein